MPSQLFMRKPLHLLVEEMKDDNRLRRVLGPVQLTSLGIGAIIGAGIFVLRRTRPDAERPYRAFGYPVVPALYILAAAAISVALLLYRTSTTWPGLVIVLTGIPVYLLWRRGVARPAQRPGPS